ncbi:B-box zinc finger protein 20-like [Pistacia vera]|uniref:B-box zinc finger protein 20-like n=1 Tax=Pistacia vera TaxID=55513 RepID=UPI001262E9BA|nr:B-box zinc finger protein 20-like [Pistacia vera]
MKIRCDVCDKEEASVFCSADEAALCHGCDGRVHHANKLASKHLRFSLFNPSFKDSPLCDICQERRALLFCQENRAILCRDCDISIHKANEHTKKHNRFLLTGIKLTASSSSYPTSSSSNCCDTITTTTTSKTMNKSSASVSNLIPSTPYKVEDNNQISDNCSVSTSSISEFLMETLPGWCVEDFLDPSSSAASNVMCKTSDKFLSFGEEDHSAIWVPEVFVQSPQVPLYCPQNGFTDGLFKESTEANSFKFSRKWYDNGFTVPHISTQPFKKPRYSR